ncbi:hypothetical protein RDABS01_013338 [Bienertia sinuspersici]
MREDLQLKWNTQLQLYNNIDEEDYEFCQKMELPHDMIIYDIVTRLPIKSILKYKSVSKQWYNSLSSSNFGNAHFKLSSLYHPFSTVYCVLIHSGNYYYLYSLDENEEPDHVYPDYEKGLFKLDIDFDYSSNDEIFLIGSCNGLLCLYSLLGYLIIWNPIIHEWAKFSYPLMKGFQNSTWGFGYVSSTDDYKVVRINSDKESRVTLAHVFSLRTQKWKQIHDDSLHGIMMPDNVAGVLINETLYWIMHKQGDGTKQGIIGYDLVHEKFKGIRGLIPSDSYLSSFQFLGCMGGSLAMGRYTNRGDVSITILKQNGQMEYIGLYRDMNLRSCSAVIGFTKGGKFLVQLGDQELGLVDPSSLPKRYNRVLTFKSQQRSDTACVLSHTPSLISPFAVADMCKE